MTPTRTPQVQRHALDLGPGAGIRDLAVVPDGVLVMSGPSVAGDPAPFALWHWDGAGLLLMARFADLGDAKAEGLMVLAASDDRFEVLVVFDDVKQGRPHEYRLPRSA